MSAKRCLGNSIYVDEGELERVVLTTEDSVSVSNRIVLEPFVLKALIDWLEENLYLDNPQYAKKLYSGR